MSKKSFFVFCTILFLHLVVATTLLAQVSFLGRRDFFVETGNGPITSTAADFDGDEILDLAVGNAFSDNVSIFLGDGNGGFRFLRDYRVVQHPFSIVAKDFDGDAILDLAVANYGDLPPRVSVLLGNGDGSFREPRRDFIVSDINSTLVAADFNNDDIPDLAVACLGIFDPQDPKKSGNQISVLLGEGSGSVWRFRPAMNFPVEWGPEGIDAGDFNGDGYMDLAVANLFSDTITVLLGDGTGNFPTRTEYSVIPDPPPVSPCGPPARPSTVVIDDYNDDGALDIAVLNEGLSTISVFLGDGFGNFGAPTSYTIPLVEPCLKPRRIVKGDFNGDGIWDLAVAGGESDSVAILLGDGQGGFISDPSKIFAAGPLTAHIAVGDFNSDGLMDLVVANKGQLFAPPDGDC